MDLAIIVDGWPFDEKEQANNIRKVVGLDRRLKLQIRLRDGVIQWEVEGPPAGGRPYGRDSVLAYCRELVEGFLAAGGEAAPVKFRLGRGLLDDLERELQDYTRRREAFMLIGDYAHALNDARHALEILEFVRQWEDDAGAVFHLDRCRPQIIADKARAEALLAVQEEQMQRAVRALSRGIEEIEQFYHDHGLGGQLLKSRERKRLVDYRRSLRERYSVALTDAEILRALQAEQQVAIEQENYEAAARLRDKISLLRQKMSRAE